MDVDMPRFLLLDLQFFRDLLFEYRWFEATFLAVSLYVYATYWYWRMWHKAVDSILLAPISVRGGISEKLGAHEAGLVLRTQLSAITDTFRKATRTRRYLYVAETVVPDFETMDDALLGVQKLKANEVIEDLVRIGSEMKLEKDLIVKVGPIEIPVGAIVNLFKLLIRWFPVRFKKRYWASLTYLSLVSSGDETQLLVRRGEQRPVLASTAAVRSLTDLSDLLRDAAFMVLQLNGKVFKERNWLGMRCYVDGLDAMDEYRRTGKDDLLDKARKSFGRAAEGDPDNYDALYFYASMLMVERSRESITLATKLFTRALETENLGLRSFVNTGLANCYVQQFLRLAKRKTDVLKRARECAEQATREWRKATGSEHSHPWTLATRALVGVLDEGILKTRQEANERFLVWPASLVQAIEMEPENGTFHNTLGWLLMSLAQMGFQDMKMLRLNKEIPPDFLETPATAAEYYFLRSLELNPKNKLSHANLCLLYAAPHYREHTKENLIRCRYHGLKAIQLDPQYIEGHRDLALSLLRYREFDEAYGYFEDALRLAATVETDQEIIADALSVLKEIQVRDEKEQERWRHPDLSLLVPPN